MTLAAKVWVGLSGEIAAPRCVNCQAPMRHSCSEKEDRHFECRVYECVGCRSTQTFVTPDP
jgi:hypothetical protein